MKGDHFSYLYKCPFIAVICAEKSIMKTKSSVFVIYAARLRRYCHFLRIHLVHSEISLVNGESSITAVLIDVEICVSTVAFKYRWEE